MFLFLALNSFDVTIVACASLRDDSMFTGKVRSSPFLEHIPKGEVKYGMWCDA